MSDERSFSKRFNYKPEDSPIRVREDAPESLRFGLVMLADHLGLSPHDARLEVCSVLLQRPDPGNWSAYPNVFDEVQSLIEAAPWYRVYDIAERFFTRISASNQERGAEFADRLNELLREHGIGWELRSGKIVARGSEVFEQTLRDNTAVLGQSGHTTAANEIHEALQDISRRPSADVTGAIQHAMAALECVAREVTGQPNKTLGQLVGSLGIPKPMDTALEKLWGFASEQGRHIREGRSPRFEEAELIVTIASAVSVYLLRATQQEGVQE